MQPLIIAFQLLTRIPIPVAVDHTPYNQGHSMLFYPLVGAVIGAVLMLFGALLETQPAVVQAALLLSIWVGLTGALHLDGLADSADGWVGGMGDRKRILEIMKDPRTGSWAVIGLILLLLAKWQAIQHIPLELLILPPVMGRWAMVLVVYSIPYGRKEGMGGFFRDGLEIQQVVIATSIAFVIAVQLDFAVLMISVFCFTWLFGKWSASRLGGGITGDVYGATC